MDYTGFQWDDGNKDKNWIRHRVTFSEAEEVFFQKPLIIQADAKHSSLTERRYVAMGQTRTQRLLTIIFTVRKNYIRIISALSMSYKERQAYEKNL